VNISPAIHRHIPAQYIAATYSQHAARKNLISEVQRAAENPKLAFLRPEGEKLGEILAQGLAEDAARIEGFEATIKPLEAAIKVEAEAIAAFDLAHREYGIGSLARETCLALRDDFHFVDQALGIRRRELAEKVEETRRWVLTSSLFIGAFDPKVSFEVLATEDGHLVQATKTRTVSPCDFIAKDCVNRVHRKDLVFAVIDQNFWKACLAMSENDFRWLGFHAARALAFENLWLYSPEHDPDMPRSGADCKPDFLATLARLKVERARHVKAKAAQAANALEAAKGAVAQMVAE
jgi:hypothetical protein